MQCFSNQSEDATSASLRVEWTVSQLRFSGSAGSSHRMDVRRAEQLRCHCSGYVCLNAAQRFITCYSTVTLITPGQKKVALQFAMVCGGLAVNKARLPTSLTTRRIHMLGPPRSHVSPKLSAVSLSHHMRVKRCQLRTFAPNPGVGFRAGKQSEEPSG